MGGATLASLVIGLARNKAVALIGGPAAVGLLGLFTALVSMGASVATLGLDTSAVRQIAQQSVDESERARTQRAVWTMAWPLALAGAGLIWLFRQPLAEASAHSASYARAVGWLAAGVATSVIAAAQLAVLQAHGRIGDLARVRLWGSVVATAIGIGAVYVYGVAGIVAAVVATPVITCLLAFWVGRNLPSARWNQLFAVQLSDQWGALVSIGAIVMITNFVGTFSQLATRSLVTRDLGLGAAGFYHACWSITWVNLSLVLNAMAADYFPRLSKVAHEPHSASEILNQQVHVALLLAGPALALVSIFAPLVLSLLYSSAFSDSALLLRLFLVAGVLRLPIWALGYVLLARRAGRAYFMGELAASSIVPLTWILLPSSGLNGAAIAALVAGLISFFFYLIPVHRSHSVRLSRENAKNILILVVMLLAIAILFEFDRVGGLLAGLVIVLALSWRCYRQMRSALAVS